MGINVHPAGVAAQEKHLAGEGQDNDEESEIEAEIRSRAMSLATQLPYNEYMASRIYEELGHLVRDFLFKH